MRKSNNYDPQSEDPFRLSRSKIDLFVQCQRCFYLDRRLGIKQPFGPPFTLNNAVDALLKKEFDTHRIKETAHPLMKKYGIDAVPYKHEKLEEWRDSLRRGITYHHGETNFVITGGIDDVWINPKGELHIVDYKATSKKEKVSLDGKWQQAYKRQMEIYQWLFNQNGFKVSPIGYFVYCNGNTDKKAFDGKLEFDVDVIPYSGDGSWIEPILTNIQVCLSKDSLPEPAEDCEYCKYRAAASRVETE